MVAGLSVLFYWQHHSIRQLQAENAAFDAGAAELDLLRDEVEDLRKSQVDESELERARQAQSEVLRLRGEVSQLRDQLKKERLANQAAAAGAVAPPAPVAEEVAPPVENYTATLRATMAPQQMLVTGGWKMPNGKRSIVLMEPALIANNPGEAPQVMIQAKIVELTEEAFSTAGLAALRSEGKTTAAQSVLESDQARLLMESLLTTPGVNVLSTPRVSTLDGRQAQMKITNLKTIGGTQYELGPSLDVIPRVLNDGTMDMSVTVRLQMETIPAK